jgi:hypothetical protein
LGWREIIGIVLFVGGLLTPSVGRMLDHDFRAAAVALCALGLIAFYSERTFRRRKFGEPNVAGMNEGDAMDMTIGHGHDGHDGGDGSGGDH